MPKPGSGSFSLFVLLVFLPALAGFSPASLNDIETAILQQDYARAKALARELLEQKPSDSTLDEARYYMALSHLRLKEYAEAREILGDLRKQAKEERLRDKAHLGLVDSLYMEGRYEEALQEVEKLLKTRPKSEMLGLIYLKLARANLKLARWETARGYLTRIT